MTRANNFDGLRLIAAMAVLLSHMAALGGEQEWRPVQGQTWGLIGVFVFFSISGYLVMGSWRSDPDIGRFLARRFLRIAPGLAVVMPLAYLIAYALGLVGFPNNPLPFLNGSLWTIEYEVLCYFILIGLAATFRFPALLACLMLAVAYALGLRSYLLLFGAFFAAGMVLFEYPAIRKWWWAVVGLGAATLPYSLFSLVLIVAPLVIEIGTRSWPVMRSAGRYGDLSYGIYIYAFPVQQMVVAGMGAGASYWTLLAITVPVVLALAWMSWHYVEAPALLRKPRRPDHSPDAAWNAAKSAADSSVLNMADSLK